MGGIHPGSIAVPIAMVAVLTAPAPTWAAELADAGASVRPLAIRLLVGEETVAEPDGAAVVRLGPATAFTDTTFTNIGPIADDPATCLAQAVYFEARSESIEGQEAVAQVVVNRTRRPEFPHSICGVVYQGSERATGCQFTFVCDGSLREPDDDRAWARAQSIARQALSGFVYGPLREATHYHASWMTPYWSSRRTRIRRIGGHVFYR